MARTPKPTALKELAGNPGRRPLNKREPRHKGRVICPRWISKRAKVEWRRMAPDLKRMGLLTKADQVAFANYCQVTAELEEMNRILGEEGSFIGKLDPKPHPALQERHRLMTQLRQFVGIFGLSPSDRTRLQVDDGAGGEEEEFLFGGLQVIEGGRSKGKAR